jgi:hypothetical protein
MNQIADRPRILKGLAVLAVCFAQLPMAGAQRSDPAALQAVHDAVTAELAASKTDRSIWMYTERDDSPEKRALYETIETDNGTLRRMLELNGQRLSGEAQQAEIQRINDYVHDSAAQAKARRAGAHDDAQATEMTKMLPDAFIWTIASETGDSETLRYRPNPDFDPPDMQARVMGKMAGEMVLSRPGNRIKSLRGKLTDDIRIGWGLLGKLNRGGTFDVERRVVGDGRWQITESHVHIGGHALIFKTIGQQEDDVKTDWKPSPAQTLGEAAKVLTAER